eukprot:scaffold118515_cov28-Tisochrysis_lutea.AAC.8
MISSIRASVAVEVQWPKRPSAQAECGTSSPAPVPCPVAQASASARSPWPRDSSSAISHASRRCTARHQLRALRSSSAAVRIFARRSRESARNASWLGGALRSRPLAAAAPLPLAEAIESPAKVAAALPSGSPSSSFPTGRPLDLERHEAEADWSESSRMYSRADAAILSRAAESPPGCRSSQARSRELVSVPYAKMPACRSQPLGRTTTSSSPRSAAKAPSIASLSPWNDSRVLNGVGRLMRRTSPIPRRDAMPLCGTTSLRGATPLRGGGAASGGSISLGESRRLGNLGDLGDLGDQGPLSALCSRSFAAASTSSAMLRRSIAARVAAAASRSCALPPSGTSACRRTSYAITRRVVGSSNSIRGKRSLPPTMMT